MGGIIASVLPLLVETMRVAPQMVEGGKKVFESAKEIWATITAEEEPTPEQRQEYDDAEAAAFAALMESTQDVAEDED